MSKKLKGGLETVIAIVIVVGLVVALILTSVVPMTQQGDALIGETTNALVEQQVTIGPK